MAESGFERDDPKGRNSGLAAAKFAQRIGSDRARAAEIALVNLFRGDDGISTPRSPGIIP